MCTAHTPPMRWNPCGPFWKYIIVFWLITPNHLIVVRKAVSSIFKNIIQVCSVFSDFKGSYFRQKSVWFHNTSLDAKTLHQSEGPWGFGLKPVGGLYSLGYPFGQYFVENLSSLGSPMPAHKILQWSRRPPWELVVRYQGWGKHQTQGPIPFTFSTVCIGLEVDGNDHSAVGNWNGWK